MAGRRGEPVEAGEREIIPRQGLRWREDAGKQLKLIGRRIGDRSDHDPDSDADGNSDPNAGSDGNACTGHSDACTDNTDA